MERTLKHSKQRDALLALLKSVKCHPDAEWLYAELKKDYPKISLATVYRNLSLLVEQGEAISLDVGDGSIHYDAQTFDHNHFFCKCCRSLTDIGQDEADGIDSLLEERYGVRIDSHSFVFYGLCRECNKSENQTKQ